MPATTQHARALRKARRWIVGVAIVLVLVASGLVVVTVGLVRMSPSWWRTTQLTDPATIQIAESIENDVVNVIYTVRGVEAEAWSVVLRAPDANAWLNTRLVQWLENADAEFEWPEGVSDLQVEFDDGLIHVGLRVEGAERSQVLSVSLRPEFREDGSLWVRGESVHIGRLPLPADWVIDQGGALGPEVLPAHLLDQPVVDNVLRALAGRVALATEPVLRLGDGRRVRLLGLISERGQLRMTCRTEFEDEG